MSLRRSLVLHLARQHHHAHHQRETVSPYNALPRCHLPINAHIRRHRHCGASLPLLGRTVAISRALKAAYFFFFLLTYHSCVETIIKHCAGGLERLWNFYYVVSSLRWAPLQRTAICKTN